jgi:predicted phosphohydrolase
VVRECRHPESVASGRILAMSRLFALADLHLSGTGLKPMDVFGDLWRDHSRRMAEAWDDSVDELDTVLLPGDISWARNLEEARPDLAWIGARPGRKILLRGNHDSWWTGLSRVRAALPERCELLQNNALEFEQWVLVGARGWTAPDDPYAQPGDDRLFTRELGRLRASIEDADRRFGRSRPRLAVLHYPPWLEGREATEVVDLMVSGGVSACVYGHLHGEDHALAVTGTRRGIRFWFVAADAVDFEPLRLELPRQDEG